MTHGHQFPPTLEHDYRVVDGRIHTRSLEAHVVDHCNLTCAQCCSLSPHLPPWYADVEALEHDLRLAAEVLRPRVFKLVGGEPLLHPRLLDLVRAVRHSGISTTISITTNGLLLTKMSDEIWSEIDALTISLYPKPALPPATLDTIRTRAERFDVNLNWKEQTHFVVMDRARPCQDPSETAAIYAECWLRERCHMIRDGRFYMCTRPPHMQAYFDGTEDFTGDGILLEHTPPSRILDYLHRQDPLAACAHCYGGRAAMMPHRLLAKSELVRKPR